MAKTATKTKGSALGAAAAAVLCLALISSGGGSSGGRPRYLPGDPCPEGTPPEHVLQTLKRTVPGDANRKPEEKTFQLDCEGWRDIALQIWLDGDRDTSSSDVLNCIEKTILNGVVHEEDGIAVRSTIFLLDFQGGAYAHVVADLDTGFVTSAKVNKLPWAQCAA